MDEGIRLVKEYFEKTHKVTPGIQKTQKEEKSATNTKQLPVVEAEGQLCLFDMQRDGGMYPSITKEITGTNIKLL